MRGRLIRQAWAPEPALYAPPRYRRACDYHAFLPDPLERLSLSVPAQAMALVSDAEAAIARLNAGGGRALGPLARLLLRTESIASSKVEGMQVDARSLARAEVADDTGRKAAPTALDVLANIDAMQFAIETAASVPITADALLAVHRVLLQHEPNRHIAGRFREKQNWIGGNDYNPCGAAFVPPPLEYVAGLIDDLCAFCDQEELPPLVQAALAHAQFETIHPFDDGNGRTGRALVQILLRRRGLAPSFVPPVSVVFARHKDRYIRGLTAFREDAIVEWLEIFAAAAAAAARLAERYLERVIRLQDHWRRRLKEASNPRADSAAWTLIDILPAHPVLTGPVGVAATGRTKPAVNNAIRELVAAGVLAPAWESQRNRAWEAGDLLDLIAGVEEGAEI